MKKKLVISLLLCGILATATGCKKEILVSRNIYEANQYVENNIREMTWSNFQQLLTSDSTIKKEDFILLQNKLGIRKSSFYLGNKTRMYNFNDKNQVMYIADWETKKGEYKLKDIHFVE